MSYDHECYRLAKQWLQNNEKPLHTQANVDELAQQIQDTIEDFIVEKTCAECGHPLAMHDDKYGCEYETDGWVTGNQPGQPTVEMTRPCGCRGVPGIENCRENG